MSLNFQRWRGLLICLALTMLIVGVYWPVSRFEFINLDDQVYVTDNPHVRAGLTWASVKWALGSWEAEFWHPLTWLTHMADVAVYGLKAGGHHLTNLLLHLINTLLVFVVFRRLTGAAWRSGLIAGLFGLHPLHVETVAWVADRKDLVSALFWWLTVWAYARYAEASKAGSGKRRLWYGLGLVFFALGLLSKPMVVTLPFVLLLLDWWPLGRVQSEPVKPRDGETAKSPFPRFSDTPFLGLIWEKVPYFVVTLAGSVLAYVVQARGGGLVSVAKLPVWGRVSNALVSYVRYLGKTVWPSHLAVYYPHPGTWPLSVVLGSCLVLLVITGLVVFWRRSRPCLIVGWLWYVGTLVPVIGLVQIGNHALADRYTYIPLVGLFVMAVWGAGELLGCWRHGRAAAMALSMVVLLGCAGCAWFQLKHWRNSVTLFRHALAVTDNNYLAHDSLGLALFRQGRVAEAISHHEKALRLKPEFIEAHLHLGDAAFQQGRDLQAINHYEQVLRVKPGFADVHNNLGIALVRQGRVAEGISHFEAVLRLKPDEVKARNNLGIALWRSGEQLAAQSKWVEAIGQYARSVAFKPDNAQANDSWGWALSRTGRFGEAVVEYEQALAIDPRLVSARNNLAWLLATCADQSVRNGPRAVDLAHGANQAAGGKDAAILDTLAAAYAEAGRFADAVRTAQKAVALVQEAGPAEAAQPIQARLQLYQAGRPYHEESGLGP